MEDQSAQPKTFTMQISVGASHLIVTVPSTSLSQKQEPEILSPQSAFCIMMQLAMNLKFLLTVVIFLRIYDSCKSYIVADLVGPYLRIVDVVGFGGEVVIDNAVDFLLDERTDVVEDSFFLLGHLR